MRRRRGRMERSRTQTEAKILGMAKTLGTAKARRGSKVTLHGANKPKLGTTKASTGPTRAKRRDKILFGNVRTKNAFSQKTSCT